MAENREYPAAANERISYTSDAIYGSVSEPMTLHFGNTGVDEYGGISLYPNPTNDKVFIQGHDLVSVKVYNAMGQLVLTEDCGHADLFELNLGSLSDGVYTAAITLTEGKTAVKRIIKK